MRRSLAKARPSCTPGPPKFLDQIHQRTPSVDAPRKEPELSRAIAATDAWLEFFDVAASTLILTKSSGGGNPSGALVLHLLNFPRPRFRQLQISNITADEVVR